MEKEVSLQWGLADRVKLYFRTAGEGLSNVYSWVMDEKVTASQAWKLTKAQVALVLVVFTAGIASWISLMLAVWFLYTLRECKRAGIK